MHRYGIIVLLLFINSNLYSQSLSPADLTAMLSKKNWESVNQILTNRGWSFNESTKGDLLTYETITWAYGISRFSDDKANNWFTLYTNDGVPAKLSYQFHVKTTYNSMMAGFSAMGMKRVNSEIKDNQLETAYANAKYYARIITGKAEDSYYKQTTVYSILLEKISSLPVTYDAPATVTVDPSAYFDNQEEVSTGKHKSTNNDGSYTLESYANGMKNGPAEMYDPQGNLTYKYFNRNDKLDGPYTAFNNGEVTETGSYINDFKTGPYKQYENGRISIAGNYLNDNREGLHTIYYYDEESGSLLYKSIGNYKADDQDGLWNNYYFINGKNVKFGFQTFSMGLLNGLAKEVQSDSILLCNYENGELAGPYRLYLDHLTTNGQFLLGDTSKAYLSETGTFKNNLKDGHCKTYNPKRMLLKDVNYVAGVRQGTALEFFTKENVVCISTFEQDILQTEEFVLKSTKAPFSGTVKTYYPNNKVKEEINVKDGKRNGIWRTYDERGAVSEELNYLDGSVQQ